MMLDPSELGPDTWPISLGSGPSAFGSPNLLDSAVQLD